MTKEIKTTGTIKRTRRGTPRRSAAGGKPIYDPAECMERICMQLATTDRSLRSICSDDGMPEINHVLRWIANDEVFAKMYQLAREAQADVLADQIIEIADADGMDTVVDDEGNVTTNPVRVARDRLRVDSRKWISSKLKPGTYGDKVQAETRSHLKVSFDISIGE